MSTNLNYQNSDYLAEIVRQALAWFPIQLQRLEAIDEIGLDELEAIASGRRRVSPSDAYILANALGCLAQDIQSHLEEPIWEELRAEHHVIFEPVEVPGVLCPVWAPRLVAQQESNE